MTLPYKQLLERSTDKLNDEILPNIVLVNPLSESLKCCHCSKILQRPQQLSCGQRICLNCVKLFMDSSPVNDKGVKYCKEDDEELDENTFPDVAALKDILYLSAYCLRKDDGCFWKGDLKDIEEHLQTCNFNIEIQCKYREYGCNFKGAESQMKHHMETSQSNHDAIVTTAIVGIEQSAQTCKQITDAFDRKAERVATSFQVLRKEMTDLKQAIQETELLKQEMELDNDFDERIERLKKNRSKLLEMKEKISDEIKKAEKFTELIKSSAAEGEPYEKQIDTLNQKLKRLDVIHKQNSVQMKDIELKTKLYQSTTYDGTYIWKLDNLQKRYLDAVAGNVTELLTPPLYTSRFGYKFCAKLLLNGDAKPGERSQHIAIYLILMRGDFDDILSWPFRNLVKITLLNMDPKKQNIERVLIPRVELQHFHKPTKFMNNAIGFPRFCSQDSLYSEGYVRDDSLFVKIEVESATIDI